MDHCINNLSSDRKAYHRPDMAFVILAGAAVITSALHFWPFEDNKLWQMLNIPNLCCAAALASAVVLAVSKKQQEYIFRSIPHISVVAYWVINILSVSMADSLSRPLNYTVKLVLAFTGGFFLFQTALARPKVLRLFYILIAAAVSLSILGCLTVRLAMDSKQFGFHDNVFKYGTYIGILVPLAGIYLLHGSRIQVLWGIMIIAAGIFSTGSAGGCFAILSGLITGLILTKKAVIRRNILICILLSTAAVWFSDRVFEGTLRSDIALKEKDHLNLRQRYIEWQAEINLLKDRGVIGTGAGCVNDYRSNFYYRLAKLNTLKSFDQNGFLAVGAETGILGLVTFIWILCHYGGMCFQSQWRLKTSAQSSLAAMATANTAAFVSALAANLFSSVHYNGNLIVFVLLLSLISSVNRIYGETTREN